MSGIYQVEQQPECHLCYLSYFSKCQVWAGCISEPSPLLLSNHGWVEAAVLKVQSHDGSSRRHQVFKRQPGISVQEVNTLDWHNGSSPWLMTQEQGFASLLCQTKSWQWPSALSSFTLLTVKEASFRVLHFSWDLSLGGASFSSLKTEGTANSNASVTD